MKVMYTFPKRLAIVNVVNKLKLPNNIIFHLLVINPRLHIYKCYKNLVVTQVFNCLWGLTQHRMRTYFFQKHLLLPVCQNVFFY